LLLFDYHLPMPVFLSLHLLGKLMLLISEDLYLIVGFFKAALQALYLCLLELELILHELQSKLFFFKLF